MPEVRHASQEVGADSAPTIVEAASNIVEQGKLDRLEKNLKLELWIRATYSKLLIVEEIY
ncbi:hypothetical protein A3E04_01860 [Candidatus Kuenenbacteria bacterium RIFCSPHIGHO2_12_FULL_42_14]|uniref:Uncharacterized protein n=2 Tax=Candidatus Kueneniibacteriota TaxID=1752740 RepID=A0A0G0YSX0_9BACT|nr:MAG: hypothetical protein UV02_C0057G0004 [Candidatus Kuenenbacteria bacterium GW2011_GWA2_42_15]OGG98608.1 MAG: hypothetical protein A3E04_01860 [Candidatus Kuenenbacteria bacterium RIFCSPHIGHO2_12_FULL_42_14]